MEQEENGGGGHKEVEGFEEKCRTTKEHPQ